MKRFPMLLAAAAVTASLFAAPAMAGESSRHSAAASEHSAQAVSHGSAAAATGAVAVASVPVTVSGAALSVTGAALESAGAASTEAVSGLVSTGLDLSNGAKAKPAPHAAPVRPDGPPTLD